ncbi:MAG: hypothetical protein IJJ23_04280, partial [Clostridia bacterium]|nr:hypothetical protein [Clostridia bacterium]
MSVEMPAAETPADAADPDQKPSPDGAAEGLAERSGGSAPALTEEVFQADAYSVYAVVVTETIETKYIDAEGATWRIEVGYGADAAIPAGSTLQVSEVEGEEREDYLTRTAEAVGEMKVITLARYFDITILDAEGNPVQPETPVTVSATLADATQDEVQAVHFTDEALALVTAGRTEEEAVTFDAESFSVWGIVYTVDFHWEVDGKTYTFTLPGGGYVGLEALVEVLGIAGEAPAEAAQAPAEAETDVLSIEEADAPKAYAVPKVTLDVTPSEAARNFVAGVQSVEFSTPGLLSVSPVEENTTVAELVERLGLQVEYSAWLTEADIAEINAQSVEAGDWALISAAPFDTEETLTVTMNTGETFDIRVTDAQLTTMVIDARGDTWEITVTYDERAGIPEDARLVVREILPEDEAYQDYYQQSLKQICVVNTDSEWTEAEEAADGAEEQVVEFAASYDNYAHIFDIEIWVDDAKVEPAADVSVSIKLLDTPEDDNHDLKVVHFGKDGLEVMELGENDDAQTGTFELSFLTDEFSVYSVISVTNWNLGSVLGNGPYALVTGIAKDPGATTGYSQTWGQDYFTIIVNANAMMGHDGVVAIPETSDNTSWVEKTKGLGAEGVHAWTDANGNHFVGGGATQWGFESVGNGKYRIFTQESGTRRYITHNGKEVSLTNNQGYATSFTITPTADGTVYIHDGNMYLRNNAGNANNDTGWSAWVNRNYIMDDNGQRGDDYKFRLCKESDDFDSFSARKVSASAITTNANYVIYRRLVDEQGYEALYALAHDGTFVRVYDGGDTIYWRETDKNIYWNYQMSNYPVLFTRDPTTNAPIYINPNHSTGQTLSTTAAGLTLIGKDNGDYSTAIECWDQAAYDYAGLHVTADNNGAVSLSTGTRVAETSDQFLFAVASEMPGATAEVVDTVDSDSLGIKIT